MSFLALLCLLPTLLVANTPFLEIQSPAQPVISQELQPFYDFKNVSDERIAQFLNNDKFNSQLDSVFAPLSLTSFSSSTKAFSNLSLLAGTRGIICDLLRAQMEDPALKNSPKKLQQMRETLKLCQKQESYDLSRLPSEDKNKIQKQIDLKKDAVNLLLSGLMGKNASLSAEELAKIVDTHGNINLGALQEHIHSNPTLNSRVDNPSKLIERLTQETQAIQQALPELNDFPQFKSQNPELASLLQNSDTASNPLQRSPSLSPTPQAENSSIEALNAEDILNLDSGTESPTPEYGLSPQAPSTGTSSGANGNLSSISPIPNNSSNSPNRSPASSRNSGTSAPNLSHSDGEENAPVASSNAGSDPHSHTEAVTPPTERSFPKSNDKKPLNSKDATGTKEIHNQNSSESKERNLSSSSDSKTPNPEKLKQNEEISPKIEETNETSNQTSKKPSITDVSKTLPKTKTPDLKVSQSEQAEALNNHSNYVSAAANVPYFAQTGVNPRTKKVSQYQYNPGIGLTSSKLGSYSLDPEKEVKMNRELEQTLLSDQKSLLSQIEEMQNQLERQKVLRNNAQDKDTYERHDSLFQKYESHLVSLLKKKDELDQSIAVVRNDLDQLYRLQEIDEQRPMMAQKEKAPVSRALASNAEVEQGKTSVLSSSAQNGFQSSTPTLVALTDQPENGCQSLYQNMNSFLAYILSQTEALNQEKRSHEEAQAELISQKYFTPEQCSQLDKLSIGILNGTLKLPVGAKEDSIESHLSKKRESDERQYFNYKQHEELYSCLTESPQFIERALGSTRQSIDDARLAGDLHWDLQQSNHYFSSRNPHAEYQYFDHAPMFREESSLICTLFGQTQNLAFRKLQGDHQALQLAKKRAKNEPVDASQCQVVRAFLDEAKNTIAQAPEEDRNQKCEEFDQYAVLYMKQSTTTAQTELNKDTIFQTHQQSLKKNDLISLQSCLATQETWLQTQGFNEKNTSEEKESHLLSHQSDFHEYFSGINKAAHQLYMETASHAPNEANPSLSRNSRLICQALNLNPETPRFSPDPHFSEDNRNSEQKKHQMLLSEASSAP